MNIFIVKINEMTDNAWNFGEEISDEDRILFIPDTNGNIPYYVYSKLNSLSVAPEFFPVSSKDTLQNIVFSLALACCDADGTVYICSDDKIFAPLNGSSFETRDGGTITIVTGADMENLDFAEDPEEDIESDELNNVDEEENSVTEEINTEFESEETSNIGEDEDNSLLISEEDNIESPADENENLVNTEEVDKDNSKSPKESKKTMPIKYLNILQRLDKTGLLTKNAAAIAEAVTENASDSIMALNFSLHEKIEDSDAADKIIDILSQENVIDDILNAL